MDVYPVTITFPDGTRRSKRRMISHGATTTFYRWDDAAAEGVVDHVVEAEPVQTGNRPKRRTWAIGDVAVQELCNTCGSASRSPLKRWRPPGGNVVVATPKQA